MVDNRLVDINNSNVGPGYHYYSGRHQEDVEEWMIDGRYETPEEEDEIRERRWQQQERLDMMAERDWEERRDRPDENTRNIGPCNITGSFFRSGGGSGHS